MNIINNELKCELELLRLIVQNSPDQTYIMLESGCVIDIISGDERTISFDHFPLLGAHYSEVFSPNFCTMIQAVIDETLNTKEKKIISYQVIPQDILVPSGDNHQLGPFWFESRVVPLDIDCFGQKVIMWSARDITQRVRMEMEVNYLLERDELTGVLNRRTLLNHLRSAYRYYKRYSVDTSIMVIDIDHFKMCNDQFGHAIGDQVIQHVASLCASNLRSCDYFGRFGGEEFAVIQPNTNIKQALQTAERLCSLVEKSVCHLEYGVQLKNTISIGVTNFFSSDNSANEALVRADEAMYRSKRNGRNQVSMLE